jgi:hypothetical protein
VTGTQENSYVVKGSYEFADDQPLVDEATDRLRIGSFARHIADAVLATIPRTGTVLALHGAWGIGKSTILNSIRRDIQARKIAGVRVVPFNPWWFGDQEDLVRSFFSELSVALGPRSEANRKVRRKLAQYATLVGDVPLPYAGFGNAAAKLIQPRARSVSDAREDLEHLMAATGGLTVVVMDDIDRLTSDDIQHVFRLIKSVGNLPGLVYILAFDRDVVISALDVVTNGRGRDYLEKIVQIAFEIPLPSPQALLELFGDRIQPIFAQTPEDLWSLREYQNLIGHALSALFTTPRSVMRLANALAMTYPPLHDDVHSVDYIAVEAMRIFAPRVYDVIRRDVNRFVSTSVEPDDRQTLISFYEQVVAEEPEANRKAVIHLMSTCFPKVRGALENTSFGSNWVAKWDRERRVCHEDHFPTYFEFQLPEGAFRRAELRALAEEIIDRDRVAEQFRALSTTKVVDGGTRASVWLDELRVDLAKLHDGDSQRLALPGEVTPQMLFAIGLGVADEGDIILRAGPASGFSSPPPIWPPMWLLRNILMVLSPDQRVTFLDDVIRTGKSREIVIAAYRWFVRPESDANEESRDKALITDADRNQLDISMRARLNSWAIGAEGETGLPVAEYLSVRSSLDGAGAAQAWLQSAARDPAIFVAFAEAFVKTVTSFSLGDVGEAKRYELHPRDLLEWMDRSLLEAAFLATPSSAWVSERQLVARATLERFLEAPRDE